MKRLPIFRPTYNQFTRKYSAKMDPKYVPDAATDLKTLKPQVGDEPSAISQPLITLKETSLKTSVDEDKPKIGNGPEINTHRHAANHKPQILPASNNIAPVINSEPQKIHKSPDPEDKKSSITKDGIEKPIKAVQKNMVLPAYDSDFQSLAEKYTKTREDELSSQHSPPSSSAGYRWPFVHSMHSTYQFFLKQPGAFDLRLEQKLLGSPKQMRSRTPFDVRKVVIVGVHGWFPGPVLQQIFGKPVGTSIRIATQTGEALVNLFNDRFGINIPREDITTIPLNASGKVMDRFESLYSALIQDANWLKSIRAADLIIFTAHSQGTPVAAMILAQLIREGHLNPQQQITGVLGMAGISHGPYPHMKSSLIVKYVENDTARELFEFNDCSSLVSRKYYDSLGCLLTAGAKFVAIGSWYDQGSFVITKVVPLYSAILQGFTHPNIYRALYVGASDYNPDFLSHLIVFGLKLRNFGLDDYGLVVHLSDAVQGNIYGWGTQGHQVIYEDLITYTTALSWIIGGKPLWTKSPTLLEIDGNSASLDNDTFNFDAPIKTNPFYLPWILSKLIHDENIQKHSLLSKDLSECLQLFEKWDTGYFFLIFRRK